MENKKIKVLNLYCGIGGNRRLWKDVEVTAVEIDSSIAENYKKSFPDDEVIVTDAHQYLLEHYKEFDFIWSSPPCQAHSRTNYFLNAQGVIRYPDMRLYQEIIFLSHFFEGKWVVENVISYYEPLIKPQGIGRHYLWANFIIPKVKTKKDSIGKMCGKNQKASKKSLEERNCVDPELGKHIFNFAFKKKQLTLLITEIKDTEVKQEAMQSEAQHSSQV